MNNKNKNEKDEFDTVLENVLKSVSSFAKLDLFFFIFGCLSTILLLYDLQLCNLFGSFLI